MHDVLAADLRQAFPDAGITGSMCADVEARRQLGISRYAKALQACNGRDALRDGYDEILDFLVYAIQFMQEANSGECWRPASLDGMTQAYAAGLTAARVLRELIAERDCC